MLVVWLTISPISAAAASTLSFTKALPQHKNQAIITQEEFESKDHVFKFYLDNALVPDLEFAKLVLPKYVADMNSILAKNTSRRLLFDPETDIILTSIQPFSNQASHPLPVENFEIWAYATLSAQTYSYGGYAGLDSSGAGVLAGLKWTRLYDPDDLNSNEVSDYWTQINNMLHELAHVFGAGLGEYYKLAKIIDNTGINPYINIDVFDDNDLFWQDKPDFKTDPLLWNATQQGITDRASLLDYVKYSELTATIISNDYRNEVPTIDLQNIQINVVSGNGSPVSDANVKIWSIVGTSPYQAQLITDSYTDSNGQISFAWGGASNPHNNYDFLRLIKVYKNGHVSSAKYLSIYDADIVKLIDNNDVLQITISLPYGVFLPIIQR